ncbi:MAG: YihA family ribosome biogenesis GTP-binding protein [Crocinitomicaceae bacterium]|nr:YihA family ribosome biogenesis GTP-binding protein [Crocinitomicaceae bacterium]|tara:strand:- start:2811 stop:3434 length:624 start_codon:yes stop_codon:yes gene_type:complete
MEINSVSFVKSSAHPRECPPMDKAEYAFIGRSNVGKSSLINMIVGRQKMAKISSTPGKTQLINHFEINAPDKKSKEDASWYLTDLPGFGYAKISKSERVKWERTTKQFLEGRRSLMCIMMLVDSRLTPQKVDLEFMSYLGQNGLPFVLVFTKVDKLNKSERASFQSKYEDVMLKQWHKMPPVFITSSETSEGREELLNFFEQTNLLF